MKKSTKKKNWLAQLDEVDAIQQARLDKNGLTADITRLSPWRNLPSKSNKKIVAATMIIAALLPIIGWLAGAIINPSGWASKDPTTVIVMTFLIIPVAYWYVTLPVLIVIGLLFIRDRVIASSAIFIISFIGSIFVYHETSTASETEFTG